VLLTACRQTISYLVRPGSTLTDVVFAGQEGPVSSEVVSARMQPYTSYPYFREVVTAFFERKSVDAIVRSRFEGLVRRIDRQMTTDYGMDEWLRLLEPLRGALRKVHGPSYGIPVQLLRDFFVEKQAEQLVTRLDSMFVSRGARAVGEGEMSMLFSTEDEVGREGLVELGRPARVGDARQVDGRGPERSRTAVPLWKQFEGGQTTTAPAPREVQAPTGPSEPLWKQFRKESHPLPEPGDLPGLEESVLGERGKRNRDLFIRHLFAGSQTEYERTLELLRGAESWSQASQIIAKEVFLKHQVNIYSDPAVAFTDAVEAQFRR
jgi:hypothetical protein